MYSPVFHCELPKNGTTVFVPYVSEFFIGRPIRSVGTLNEQAEADAHGISIYRYLKFIEFN